MFSTKEKTDEEVVPDLFSNMYKKSSLPFSRRYLTLANRVTKMRKISCKAQWNNFAFSYIRDLWHFNFHVTRLTRREQVTVASNRTNRKNRSHKTYSEILNY